MANTTLSIRNGRIIDPSTSRDTVGDLSIENGRIVSALSEHAEAEVIDATGLLVCPGFTDVHVHLREPGYDEAETIKTGLRAAEAGGFTTVVAMPNTTPPLDNVSLIEWMTKQSQKHNGVTLLPSACMSRNRAGSVPLDYDALKAAGAVAFTDDGSTPASVELLQAVAEAGARLDMPILDHAEDPDIPQGVMHQGEYSQRYKLPGIPSSTEINMVKRDIALADTTGCHLHIQHISARESLDLIKNAQDKKIPVTAEVTPHHLALCDEDLDPDNALYKMNPPLRSREDRQALRQAVAEGIISIFATDHAPHTLRSKEKGFMQAPFGIIGLETAIGLTYTIMVKSGTMPVLDWVTAWTKSPVQLLRHPFHGLRVGAPANITIIDPAARWIVDPGSFYSRSRNMPFGGWKLTARPVQTITSKMP